VHFGRLARGPITILLVAFEVPSAQNDGHPLIRGELIRRSSMFIRFQKGQGLAEYALILSLIAIVVIIILGVLGGNINKILSTIAAAL
jgi:pilus assembly protein Flp/PilA